MLLRREMKDDVHAFDRPPNGTLVSDIAIQRLNRWIGSPFDGGVPREDDDASGTSTSKLGDKCFTDRPRATRYKEAAPADGGVEGHAVVAARTVRPRIAAIRSAAWPSPKGLNGAGAN